MKTKRWVKAIIVVIVAFVVALCIAFFVLTCPAVKIKGWQELDLSKLEVIHKTISIKDIDGNIIADEIYSKNRIYTPLEEIPQWTRDAFISIEDKRFYKHNGVDYIRMLGAFKNNILAASLREGASTITQQLIKNTHLSNEKTFSRKLREIRIAKELEKKYSKEQILEAYLNILYFGNNVYGIGQAAKTYFNKNVSELNVSESAMLAGIINNPSRFNPLTQREKTIKRRNVVIDRMASNKKITRDVANNAKSEKIDIKEKQENLYSAYIENVIVDACEALDCLPEELFERKPIITTNAKARFFNKIYCSMSDILYKNDSKIRVILTDNISSAVIGDFSNMSGTPDIKRQPGSVIKPFVSYAPALEKKLIYPASIITDEKTNFDNYSPKNFGDKYYGNVTVIDSLKKSLNVPAVKLTDMCGIPYSKSLARRFGIEFSDKDNGLAIALGGMNEGVNLKTLVDAYATLARMGIYSKSRYVDSICIDGKVVYKNKPTESFAVGKDIAFLITDMLRECAQTGTAKKLHTLKNVAAKTGTVERGDSNSDAYCIAYTPRYTVAVWYGNDDGADIYGGNEAAALAKTVLEKLNDKSEFVIPDSVEKLSVDRERLYKEGVVYLASPHLQKRYCAEFYFSKNNLPNRYSYPEIPFMFDDEFNSTDFEEFEIIDSAS